MHMQYVRFQQVWSKMSSVNFAWSSISWIVTSPVENGHVSEWTDVVRWVGAVCMQYDEWLQSIDEILINT